MDPIAIVVALVVAFISGVIVHRYLVSEADLIKAHITGAESRIRADIADALKKAASKV